MPHLSMQQFLMNRAREDYVFPMNPIWPVRSIGWFEVFQALEQSDAGKAALQSWFPPSTQIIDKILALNEAHRQEHDASASKL